MTVIPEMATGTTIYQGQPYFFCSKLLVFEGMPPPHQRAIVYDARSGKPKTGRLSMVLAERNKRARPPKHPKGGFPPAGQILSPSRGQVRARMWDEHRT